MSISSRDLNILHSLGFQSVEAFRDVVDVIKIYLDYIECKKFGNYIIKEDIADYLKDIIQGVFNANPDMYLIHRPIDLGHPDIVNIISETIDWLLIKHDVYNEYRHRPRSEYNYQINIHPDVKSNIIYFINLVTERNVVKQQQNANNSMQDIDNMMNSMSLAQSRSSNPVAQTLNNSTVNTSLEDVFSEMKM